MASIIFALLSLILELDEIWSYVHNKRKKAWILLAKDSKTATRRID